MLDTWHRYTMAESNPALYRWKRWTSPKPTNTPSKKVTNNDDIQDWIKKVQEASDRAAALTFGHRYTGGSHGNSLSTAMATVDALHDHDDAYSEAQELLNQWMSDKCVDENDTEDYDDYLSSPRRPPPTKNEVKRQWDNLLDYEDTGLPYQYDGVSSDAVIREIEERDDSTFIDGILQGLMDKPVIEEDFLQDLGLDESKRTKGRDPTLSMHARHQRVKENREKRTKEKEKQMQEKRRHKDSQYQAQQIVLREERDIAQRQKKEDTLIQQEMAKIRKEMEAQRRLEEETKRRDRERRETEKEKESLERERRRMNDEMRRLESQQMMEEERSELKYRLEELKVLKAAENIKCLQKHFSAWYKLVMNRRLQMGKARALGDWRCLVRSWNAWRAYARRKQMKREERETHLHLQHSHRNNILSIEHHRHNVLKKCFVAWQLYILQERQGRELTERKYETRSKMDAFLAAAASGKLWSNRGDGDKMVADDVEFNNRTSDRPDSTRQKLDALFDQPNRQAPPSHSIPTTSRSDLSIPDSIPQRPETLEKPQFAWQVTRKHINLTNKQLANRGNGDTEQNNAPSSVTAENIESDMQDHSRGRKPIPYTVNNFEHRYAAQQKLLQDQQSQLKEQQRLIVDLQATQRQQLLHQELNNIRGVSTGEKATNVNKVNEVNVPVSARSQPDTTLSARSDSTDNSSTTLNNAKRKTESNFVKGMEERAARIAQRKMEGENRKRLREEEKLARIQADEEKRLTEEEEERKVKVERFREERRLTKQREQEKQRRLENITQLNNKADEHYRNTLLRNKGLKPWLRLVQTSKLNMQVAVDHYNTQILCRCFMPWKDIAQEIVREKEVLADELYKYLLVRRAFSSWRSYGHLQSIQLQKARRHYAYTAKCKYFKLWQDYVTEERIATMRKEEMALDHNQYRILKTSFTLWRQYPKMRKLIEEKEKRREELRKKVQAMLPDFGS